MPEFDGACVFTRDGAANKKGKVLPQRADQIRIANIYLAQFDTFAVYDETNAKIECSAEEKRNNLNLYAAVAGDIPSDDADAEDEAAE